MISNALLKKKILDDAIHGRLIENDPSLKPIDVQQVNDDIPFEIPNNWKWIHFGDLVKDCYQGINTAGDKVEFVEEDGVPIIQVGDMTSGIININNTKLMSYEDYDYYKDKYQPKYNDIFYCNIGTIGYPLIYRENYKMLFHWNIFDIKYNEKNSDVVFLKWCLEYYTDIFKNMTSGSAMKFVSKKKLLDTLFPVPPLEEQYKIANKIEELFELIDKKEKNDQEKEKLKTLLKEKILDSAIHGQLVEQNESESNSIEYIKNIKKIKENLILKKELKRDSKINYNKPQIVLPKGWNWVRLGDLGIYKKGPFGSSLTKDMFVADGPNSYKVYEQKNAIQKDWKLGNYFITKEKYDSMKSFIIKPNDIIVSCAGTIGEIYVIPQNARAGIINQALMKITLFDNSIMDFYIMYFDHVLKYESRKKGKGTAIRNIPPFDILKNIYVPLPPIEEQHRIMNKIEECFKLIEQL